ncbi:carboxyl transferase domain-containing protein [Streptomyces marincola]|uniref:acetyl-CoA carboxytransferase n=1 Tax=Streptomyces marincola TaxID=2878388 RepID=A0A1W7CRX2_9ACTN|nr:carboxyl transferase domain-containing protein [Streptomyces marincola]ARQ67482.1 acetyl-CoA carboxylase [Streptomyces marincola]
MTSAPTGRALPARELIAALTATFTGLPERAGDTAEDGPLGWDGYGRSRARARERTGEAEAVVCGIGDVGGTEAVLIAFEFGFLGGSIGESAGERLENAFITARDLGLPVVSLIASGGSRLQEGMCALTQLQRVARQLVRLRAAGLPHLAVLAGPVTGGGWAALGAGADVRVALPGAQIGFAGSRVRPPGEDPRAYTAEGQFAAGHIDEIVPAAGLGASAARWLRLLTTPAPGPAEPPAALRAMPPPATGWEAVQRAREPSRPGAEAYLRAYFTERAQLAAPDPGLLCGFGLRGGRSVAYVAQRGTATRPAGFRAATRLLTLADRLAVPVLTLVDTPGAADDAEAERDGVGPAIAEALAAVAGARIPVTTLLVGEGGSGGAAALTSAGHMWVTPDSYYAVVAPERAAAVFKRGPGEDASMAEQLRLRPQDLVGLGVARGIVPMG